MRNRTGKSKRCLLKENIHVVSARSTTPRVPARLPPCSAQLESPLRLLGSPWAEATPLQKSEVQVTGRHPRPHPCSHTRTFWTLLVVGSPRSLHYSPLQRARPNVLVRVTPHSEYFQNGTRNGSKMFQYLIATNVSDFSSFRAAQTFWCLVSCK